MKERLRKLWFAYYRTSQISEILGIPQAAVVVQANRLYLGYRAPADFHSKFSPDPELEFWPPLAGAVIVELPRVPPSPVASQAETRQAPQQLQPKLDLESVQKPISTEKLQKPKPNPPKPVPSRPAGFYGPPKRKINLREPVFDHSNDAAQIEEFLRTKGVTKVAPAFVGATQHALLDEGEEKARIKSMPTPEPKTFEQLQAERKRQTSNARRWHMLRLQAAMKKARQPEP